MKLISYIFIQIILIHIIKSQLIKNELNLTSERQPRAISFPVNGGLYKLVLGILIPSDLKFNKINWAWNLQAQYRIPEEIIVKSTHWSGRSLKEQKKSCENKEISEDTTRILFYNFLELMLNRNGINGKECIYRTICEISFSPLKHNGIFGELLDVVFMPGKEKLPIDYIHAKEAGLAGADCLSLYSKCQIGDGILDKFIYT